MEQTPDPTAPELEESADDADVAGTEGAPTGMDQQTLAEAMAQHGAMRYADPIDVRAWDGPRR